MLHTLTQAAKQLLRRFAARHEVGVYQAIESDSLLLRSQKRVEAQRAIQRKEAKALRAARKAETEAREARKAARAAAAAEAAGEVKAPAVEVVAEVPVAEPEIAKPAKAKPVKKGKAKKAEAAQGDSRTLFVTEQAAESKINLEVDSGLVSDWMEEGELLFLDVREVTELLDGHLDGALLMPQDAVERRYQEIKKDQKTVIYCMSGARSLQVATLLRARGYGDIWSMTGGFGSWVAQGGDYVTPPAEAPLRLTQSVRLSSRGRKRLSREEAVHGTVQEINGEDKGLRYTIAVPLEDGGVEWVRDLRRSDLALA